MLVFSVFLIFLIKAGGVFGAWPDDPEINVPICTAEGTQEHPRIATDGASGAIIVWQDMSSPSSDIYAQRVDARATGFGCAAYGVAISICSNGARDVEPL